MKRVVFWQNTPSPHYTPIARSLADSGRYEVHVITEWDVSSSRRALGWQGPDHGIAQSVVAPNDRMRRDLEHELGPDSFHIFSGLGVYPRTTVSQRMIARHTESPMAIVTEAWNPTGMRAPLRYLKHLHKMRQLRSSIDTYLAIGQLGYDQLVNLGAPEQNVFPFAYAVDAPNVTAKECARANSGVFTIGFVGKLESRKNVELLIRALAPVSSSWSLTIIGDGPLRSPLTHLALSLGLAHKIEFLGMKSNPVARSLLANFDALVLPSKFDGWGAVVNESLHSGVPVVVSDAVGAEALLRNQSGSSVFESGNVMRLREALIGAIQRGPIADNDRRQMASWAEQAVGPIAVSEYLLKVLERQPDADKPSPPWVSGVRNG